MLACITSASAYPQFALHWSFFWGNYCDNIRNLTYVTSKFSRVRCAVNQWPPIRWNEQCSQAKSIRKSIQVNRSRNADRGITLKSVFTPSVNVLTAANKAREMLRFIKRSFACLTKEIFVPLCSALVRPRRIFLPSKLSTGSNKVGERSKSALIMRDSMPWSCRPSDKED